MNKPLTMTIKEAKSKLVAACNESKLPPVILDLILREIYLEVRSLAENQALEEEAAYFSSLKNNDIDIKEVASSNITNE